MAVFDAPRGCGPSGIAATPDGDRQDRVWVSDFGANAVLRFDPETEGFESFPSPRRGAAVRQLLGREGEVWAPESGTDTLVRYRMR